MASRVSLTFHAQLEREQIVAYLAEKLGEPSAAASFNDAFIGMRRNIERFPKMYPLCRDRTLANRGYRKAQVENYLLLYTIDGDASVIHHIFHQSQDYAALV